jgi:GNAT superfamily N-acetyltransferase
MTVQPMPPGPDQLPSPSTRAMSARSLIHGHGHPSQTSRLRQPWRLETSGLMFGIRRATASDLPGVMGTLVRSSALSRWQWRRTRGGAVPSMAEMAQWLRQPASLVVLAPRGRSDRLSAPRVIAIAGLTDVECAGGPMTHIAEAEVLVADPWQRLGVGSALVGHLAAATWLLGRRELMASPVADAETGERLLSGLGPLHHAAHEHGSHAGVRLTSTAIAGLGPLRMARLG